ncbi:MAG: transglycosylase domain-containing protein [Methyloligellaceae bacterium]
MRDWIFKSSGKRKRINWLALDSWIDAGLFDTWSGFRDWWSSYSSFFARFHVTGYRKLFVNLASESATLGIAGLLVVLSFAIPAFEETKTAWQKANKFSVTFLDRYGNEIGKRGILHSDAVPLEEIPDHMIKAALATEDRRFFTHFGIDVLGTLRALIENVKADDVVQGGSSITQQLAKNLFLTPERSLKRKINEAFLAMWLEARLSKLEILKLYLDRAYLGGGAFGVEAASQFYFNKSVRDINLAEAAMLAGLFKAPTRYAPHLNLPASRARANEVLTNMVEAGYLTEGQVHGARLNPADVVNRNDFYSPDWFLDYAFEEVQKLMRDRDEYVLTVKTTVDIGLQKAAEDAIQKMLRQYGRAKRVKQAALVAMEKDGAVRALVGGRDYGESQFNRATHALRQPGSSFKPYVYLTALENGYTPQTTVVDGPVSCGRWSPRNYSGGYRGAMPMAHALMRSLNTVAVRLSLDVGREKVLANVHKIGHTHVKKTCSMALGDTGLTLLKHTAGYAVFANGGMSVKPYGIEEIRNSHGRLLYLRERDEPAPKRLFAREKIEQLNSMLGLVVTNGTARRAQLSFTAAAGKTGTSSAWRDAWFMGFTGQYVAGVWYGNDDYSPTGGLTGGNLPAMTWKEFMTFAHATPNIPQIPGLPLHPAQLAEQQRLEELRKANPAAAAAAQPTSRLPDATREALQVLHSHFVRASRVKLEAATAERRARLEQQEGRGRFRREHIKKGEAGRSDQRASLAVR